QGHAAGRALRDAPVVDSLPGLVGDLGDSLSGVGQPVDGRPLSARRGIPEAAELAARVTHHRDSFGHRLGRDRGELMVETTKLVTSEFTPATQRVDNLPGAT